MAFDYTTGRYHPTADIADLPAAATTADAVAKINAILAALRAAGIIGGV